ncbi:PHD finger protein 7-like isoform X3 [Gallus gallus]|uniref:PHD finger protein 7-like isoform X3 n=1 Tax=Gallus gallus TaxID=9031 RepID=UPI001AE97982|nr:PHD finger protein 7-like isoform X3 [Gallus gallus]
MSDRKRKASSSEEPVCALCGQADVDPDICGHTLFETGIRVHEFCLTSANITSKARPGIEVLPLAAIARKVRQANKKQCCVCGERGAAITCAERGCARSFHLPCAKDGECITQYFGDYRSFCWEHRPQQATQEAPAQGTICLICLEPVGDSLSYHTMVCPACKHVWFHRDCIQQQALSAGTAYFECPGCRDYILFCEEMSNMGIHIPLRDASWEDEESYEPLLEMHSRCDASQCLYHGGREQAHSRGPWELILCSSCAAEGTHRQCSHLSNTTDMWECNSCAGLATGKRQSAARHRAGARQGLPASARATVARVCLPQVGWQIPLGCCSSRLTTFLPPLTASSANAEFAAPSTASQTAPAPGPSSSSMEPETFGSMPASQAALGTSQSSQLPEHSDLPSVPETEQGTNGTRSPEDRATPEQLRGRRGSRRTAAPRADSDSHTATRRRASGSSRASPAAACRRRRRQRSGRSRTRSRSPLQRRDPSSQSRPRRRHGSRRRPASREQSATRRSTRSATSRSPRASRVPRRRGQARR